ncbi:MAG TPA: hypothetical protein VIW93_12045 [Candidatus Acidoferrum sp.]
MEEHEWRHFSLVCTAVRKLGPLAVLLVSALAAQPANAQNKPPFSDLPSYVKWMQGHHKAPFDRDGSVLPTGGAKTLRAAQAKAPRLAKPTGAASFKNDQVNQDRNPWPKAEVGAAIDPTNGHNYVVMTNDFRENFDHQFFHASTDGGETWTDDSMVGGAIPATGFLPGNFQSDPGVSFDSASHSYLSTITGNLIVDFSNNYLNLDTEVELAQGFAGGTYADLLSTPIDDQPCNGQLFGPIFTCDASLDKPLITTDNSGTATDGATYVYYTLFCNFPTSGFCVDGSATSIPAFSSVIMESHSPGAGLPFSPPALVSGPFTNTQFSHMVIDSSGTPHIFFDDFTNPMVNMYESTLFGGNWVVNPVPVASFSFFGNNNINWAFRDAGAQAPGCGIHGNTAYCAFSANQIAGGKLEATPSVYVAVVDAGSGASTIHRVNNDKFGNGKHHFFAWATATPNGNVYVGWYDDRNDPFSTKVEYFVGKSTDGGKAFSKQKAVSDVSFNPCIGFPGCGFFGDYVQLVSGPDGVVHAAWSDTRDGASMQIWSESITW